MSQHSTFSWERSRQQQQQQQQQSWNDSSSFISNNNNNLTTLSNKKHHHHHHQKSSSQIEQTGYQHDLSVFGYACNLYRDDEKFRWIDSGKHLIPWMGHDNLLVDRFVLLSFLFRSVSAHPLVCNTYFIFSHTILNY